MATRGIPAWGRRVWPWTQSDIPATLQLVRARKKQPTTLLEVNVLLAAGTFLSEDRILAGKRLPILDQARIMVKAMPKATRVAEFVAMWAILKYEEGAVTVERLSELWNEPQRTVYRRLEEFKEVWSVVGFETPDPLADMLIADYKRRMEKMTPKHLARLLSAPVDVPAAGLTPQLGT